jgi:hypothetical protein
LPSYWRTLYELALLGQDILEAALARGDIWPEMTRRDAVRLRRPEKNTAKRRIHEEAYVRIRAVVDQELRQCLLGEKSLIETILREIAADLERCRKKHKSLTDPAINALADYRDELENAAPGQRFLVRKRSGGPIIDVVSQPSTFPADMCGLPRTRRSADRLVWVCDNVYAGKICGRLERGLLDWAAAQPDEEHLSGCAEESGG